MRKGVTPVVAIVLLISITVSAAGTVYFYVESASPDVDDAASQFEEELDVNFESCWEDGTGYRYSIRNVNDAAFNSSKVDVFVNQAPEQDFNFNQVVVDTQETVELYVEGVNRGDTVRIMLSDDAASETCRN